MRAINIPDLEQPLDVDVSWEDEDMLISIHVKTNELTISKLDRANIGKIGTWLPPLLRAFYLAGRAEALYKVRSALGIP